MCQLFSLSSSLHIINSYTHIYCYQIDIDKIVCDEILSGNQQLIKSSVHGRSMIRQRRGEIQTKRESRKMKFTLRWVSDRHQFIFFSAVGAFTHKLRLLSVVVDVGHGSALEILWASHMQTHIHTKKEPGRNSK